LIGAIGDQFARALAQFRRITEEYFCHRLSLYCPFPSPRYQASFKPLNQHISVNRSKA
jgi:hypothetical protein